MAKNVSYEEIKQMLDEQKIGHDKMIKELKVEVENAVIREVLKREATR